MRNAISVCMPGPGGLFTVFLSLRRALLAHGIGVEWVAAGKSIARDALATASKADLEVGRLLATHTDDELARARAYLDYIRTAKPGVVILHVFGAPVETNLARYLPADCRRIVIVHSITPSTYRAARAIRDSVHQTVVVSPRIADDLVRGYGFDPARTRVVPNALDCPLFAQARPPRTNGQLRVLLHGRVEAAAKGTKWIPPILARADEAEADILLTVSGDGPDLPRLRSELARAGLQDRVTFRGPVPRSEVPSLMLSHDVLLFPSVFEGFGLTVAEAMAAGCVPVASHIRGVTDFIIDDGKTGLLFPVGSPKRAADALLRLYRDRRFLAEMSDRARRSASDRFSLKRYGAAYSGILERVRNRPGPISPPLPLDEWCMPRHLRPAWWHGFPAPAKAAVRILRERIRR